MKEIDNIRRYMDEAHMSQRELSQRSGIAHETISKILNGKYPLSHKLLVKIADGLNIPISELMEDAITPITVGVQGYIEYDNEIIKIKSFRQLQKLVQQIEYETSILPKEVKEIKTLNEKNRKLIKNSINKDDYEFNINDFELIQTHDATKVDCWAFKTASDTKDGIVRVIRLTYMDTCSIPQNRLIFAVNFRIIQKNTTVP